MHASRPVTMEAWEQWEGQVVAGQFPLRQYLGGSEHSAVFRTERGSEPQAAAIKLIPADPENAELQLARWRRAAGLTHPHLIRLYEMGHCRLGDRELLYVVMEHAEENLAQVLPDRPLTPAEGRDMLRPVLDVLAYLHGKGLVHGRLKPANILANADQLKVSSDGLCAVNEPRGSRRQPSPYDPPEAAAAGSSRADDVWSLGVTLVEALTQRRPAWEDPQQGEPAVPATLPQPFFEIARHCLRRDPQRRWTVADVVSRLQQPSAAPARTPRKQPGPVKPQAAKPPEPTARRRYLLPVAVAGLALAAFLVVPRLLDHPEAQPPESTAAEPAKVEPKSPRRSTPPSGQAAERAGSAKQTPREAAPPPVPIAPPAETKPPGASVVPGEVVERVMPKVSQTALDTIRGTLKVVIRVQADSAGNVIGAKFDFSGPSLYFAERSLDAAQAWKFKPPTMDGRTAPSEWLLRFEFTNTDVRAIPSRVTP